MTRRFVPAVVLLALVSMSCSRDEQPPAPAPVAAPAPAAPKVVRVAARCRGVEAGSAFLDQSQLDLARGVLKAPHLPQGWTPAGDTREPADNDASWTALGAATSAHCATVQDYDTPRGRVAVLVAAFESDARAAEAAPLVNAARGAGISPAVAAGSTLALLAPGDDAAAQAWSRAANERKGTPEIEALLAAAQGTDRAAFDAAFAKAVDANPQDGMPHAYKAGFLARLGDLAAAKAAAHEAETRAASDPQAMAETLHWQLRIARAEKVTPDVLVPLANRQVAAATSSGNEPMRARALYDRATVRAFAGDSAGASDDVGAALAAERAYGGTALHVAAASEPDFERLQALPEFRDALAK